MTDNWVEKTRAQVQEAFRTGKAVDHVGNARKNLADEKAAKQAKKGGK